MTDADKTAVNVSAYEAALRIIEERAPEMARLLEQLDADLEKNGVYLKGIGGKSVLEISACIDFGDGVLTSTKSFFSGLGRIEDYHRPEKPSQQ